MWLEITGVVTVLYIVHTLLKRQKSPKIQYTADGQEIKPYESIPGPKGWPLIGTFFDAAKYDGANHKFQEERATYGGIVRESVFGSDIVSVYDPAIIEQLAKKDGKYPAIFKIDAWIDYRRRKCLDMGILTSFGPEWKKLRSPWNHTMLKTSKVFAGIEALNKINTDFIERIQRRRNDDNLVLDIDRELFRWSLESASMFLYETRLGCLSEENKEALRFVAAVKELFATTETIFGVPLWAAKLFIRKDLQRNLSAWDIITEIAKKQVDAKILEIAKDLDDGVEPTGFLSHVIASHQLSPGEIYSTVSEIMTAAVDTTSNTMQFVLYELARNPDVQQKVYEEICEVTGGAEPTSEHLRQMDYLKATVREVQRLYPVALVASRTAPEDITLGGYHIPAGTSILADAYANGRNPNNFPDPLDLKPERWLKGKNTEETNTWANIVFGFGSRGCIGRKTAETEMHVLVIRLLQRFELKYDAEPVVLCTKGILVPSEPIAVSFVDRN